MKIESLWHNQYESVMKIEVDASGRISGKFRTAVGRPETKKDWQDSWYDLVGFLNGDLISFVVNFTTGAMYSVTGRISPSKNRIETISVTSFNLSEQDRWRSFTTTPEIFEIGPVSK